jgi:hypothetical protein
LKPRGQIWLPNNIVTETGIAKNRTATLKIKVKRILDVYDMEYQKADASCLYEASDDPETEKALLAASDKQKVFLTNKNQLKKQGDDSFIVLTLKSFETR